LLACSPSPQTHSLTPSPTHPFTKALTYSSNLSLTHSPIHSPTYLLIQAPHSLTNSCSLATYALTHPGYPPNKSYPILTQACMRISAHVWSPNDNTERHWQAQPSSLKSHIRMQNSLQNDRHHLHMQASVGIPVHIRSPAHISHRLCPGSPGLLCHL